MVDSQIRIPNGWQGKEEITVETRKMAKQLAMVYYYFAKLIVDEMGETEGTKFVKKVLRKIAIERGKAMRSEAARLGLPLTQESMWKVNDLPKYTFPADGHVGDAYCPYAVFWEEKGALGKKLGLLWCDIIDPWKIRAFVGPTHKLWKYGKNLNLKDDFCGEHVPLSDEEVEAQERL